jgi:hypothetical protein
MERFHGRVTDALGNHIAEVEGYLTVVSPPNGLKSWRGSFSVEPSFADALFDRRDLVLVLDDGRHGRFFIKRCVPGKEDVEFRGTGPLEV